MFTLAWSDMASMELAAQMRSATVNVRTQIADALREIDKLVLSEAEQVGESRSRGLRVLVVGPMVLWLSVNVRLEKVFVLHVHFPQRS